MIIEIEKENDLQDFFLKVILFFKVNLKLKSKKIVF